MAEIHRTFPNEVEPNLFSITDEASAFFKQLTKIDDDEKLKEHIVAIQREAYEASNFFAT